MCEVLSLIRQCGPATPGIIKLYLIDIEDVIAVPMANEDWTITSDIQLYVGNGFKDIPFVETKAGLVDELADAVAGGFKKSIPIKLAKYSADTNKWIQSLVGARFLAIIADNNGQLILVGSVTKPLRLEKATGNTGQKIGDENGWDLQLTAEGIKPCYFYTGSVVIDDGSIPELALIDESGEVLIDSNGEILIGV